jgi:hypothetical protein
MGSPRGARHVAVAREEQLPLPLQATPVSQGEQQRDRRREGLPEERQSTNGGPDEVASMDRTKATTVPAVAAGPASEIQTRSNARWGTA